MSEPLEVAKSEEEMKTLVCRGVDFQPTYTFTFFNSKHEKCGTLDFNQTPATFDGNVDESARSFLTAVCNHFDTLYRRPIQQETLKAAWKRISEDLSWCESGQVDLQRLEKLLKNSLV